MKKYTSITIITLLVFASLIIVYAITSSPIDNLIKPPEQNRYGNSIREALTVEIGENYILRPPEKGNNRSAFIYNDLDMDGKEEVVVFCSKNSASQQIIMLVLAQEENNSWKKISFVESDYTKINEVDFSDFDKDGVSEIVVGLNSFDNALLQKVFVFEANDKNEKNNLLFQSDYSEFKICDIDRDSVNELILFIRNEHNTGYSANLYSFNRNKFEKTQSIEIDPMISSISYVNFDYIRRYGISRIYIDGFTSDGRIVTDVLYRERGSEFLKRFKIGKENICSLSVRSLNFLCDDINKDGLIEIPTALSRSYNKNKERVICWVSLSNDDINELYYYFDFNEVGYYFKTTKERFLNFDFNLNANDSSLRVYESKSKELLFEIIRTQQGNEPELLSPYRFLSSNKNYDYYFRITSKGTLKGISKREISENIVYY